MKYISTKDRLLRMAPWFHLNDFVRVQGVEPTQARTMLRRMAQGHWIRPLGGRTGVYFNVAAYPDAEDNHYREAVRSAVPSAIEIGIGPLRDAGWITQCPRTLEVASLHSRGAPRMERARAVHRPRSWYALMQAHLEPDSEGLPRLSAPAALADRWVYQDGWAPEEGDLYWEDEDEILVQELMGDLRKVRKQKPHKERKAS